MRELTDTAAINTFRQKFEAGRSFDLDDDMEFCPNLLTESDVSTPFTTTRDLSMVGNSLQRHRLRSRKSI